MQAINLKFGGVKAPCMKVICSYNSQIDNSKPSSNSTIESTLLQNGTLAVQVEKADTGSGVNYVDIYQMTGKIISLCMCKYPDLVI